MSGFEAPTDPQLAFIRSLCEDRGVQPPEVVASKTEASEIITAIRTRQYDPRRYRHEIIDTETERGLLLGEPDWTEVAERAQYEAERENYVWTDRD